MEHSKKSFIDYLGGIEFVIVFTICYLMSGFCLSLISPIQIVFPLENTIGFKFGKEYFNTITNEASNNAAFTTFLVFCYSLLKLGGTKMWFEVKAKRKMEEENRQLRKEIRELKEENKELRNGHYPGNRNGQNPSSARGHYGS